MMRNLMLTAIGAAGLLAASTASAQIAFDFRAPNNNQGWATSRSFTSTTGGITVTATAWYSSTPTGPATQAVKTASDTDSGVGWWTGGLGASNPNEDGSNNDHTIDNVGQYDFILLTFSTPVQILSGYITPYDVSSASGNDSDAWVSFTYNPSLAAITSTSVWQNLQLHGTDVSGTDNQTNTYLMNFNPGMNTGNQWIIGAAHSTTDRDDGFKLTSLNVQLPVPEPASWAMMMIGVGVTGAGLRRRNRVSAKLARA